LSFTFTAVAPVLLVAALATRDDVDDRFAKQVDEKRLLKTVRELVAIGARMGGTPSGDAAAKYHADRFKAAGLEPVTVADPSLRAFQPRKLAATVVVDDVKVELVDGALALHTAGVEKTTLPLLLQVPENAGDAPNTPYAVLVDAPTRGEMGPTAAQHALPALDPVAELPESARPRVVLLAFEQRVESSTPVMHQPRGLGGTLLTISSREAKKLRAAVTEAPEATPALTIEADVLDAPGQPVTVYADVKANAIGSGANASDAAPILLFCAHGDSDAGSLGADDNGSGDAVVHELADVFAHLMHEKSPPALPFTIRCLVWGSEIHSTNAYVERARKDGSLARHVAVVNFDQAGTGAERDCVYFEPDDVAICQPLVRLGLDAAHEHVGQPGFWSEYTSNAALGGTDAYCFCPQSGGKGAVPAITIFTAAFGEAETPRVTAGFLSPAWKGDPTKIQVDYSRVYHETGDRPELTTELEPWDMAWVTKAAGLLALRLARSPETVKKLLDR
jgi:hypothetical protein